VKKTLIRCSLASATALLLWGASVPVTAQGQQALVIQGGTLIDGNGGAPIANSVVVVEGNRITAVGAAGQVDVPNGARVIDASGKWVLPGLIDAKANWNWPYGEAFIHYGVTSAMISGPRGDQGLAERDAINHGVYEGPRLFQTVVGIRGPGVENNRSDNHRVGNVNRVAETGEAAAQFARDYRENGADFITFTDGYGDPEIFEQAVRETLADDVAVIFRAMGPGTLAREVAAMGDGIVCIHTCNVGVQLVRDDAAGKWATYQRLPPDAYSDMDDAKIQPMVELLLEANVYLEPDLIATGRSMPTNWARISEAGRTVFEDPALLAYYPKTAQAELYDNLRMAEDWNPPEQLAMRRAGFRNQMRFLKAYVDAGGKIVAASDITQSAPGLGLHEEMSVFADDIGMTTMQVIQSATKWVAEGFKQPDIGVVEAGKLADIIVVNADPLQDILNLRQVDTVIKDGEVQDRSYDPAYKGHMFSLKWTGADGPIVDGGWAEGLKEDTYRANIFATRGEPGIPGVPNHYAHPTPGLESIFPRTLIRGTETTTVKLTGFNFVQQSVVHVDGDAVPTRVINREEIEFEMDENILAQAGMKEIHVKNPQPSLEAIWGDTSNAATLIVPFEFTTEWSQNRY
jgi:hypothetical protein